MNVDSDTLGKIFNSFILKEPAKHTCPVCKTTLSRIHVDENTKGWTIEISYRCMLKIKYEYQNERWVHIDDCTNATALVLALVADQIDKEDIKEETRFTSLDNEAPPKLSDDDVPF